MEFSPLEAISPVDGRYRRATADLADFFSENALIKYRVLVEVEYFIALCEMPLPQLAGFDRQLFKSLRSIYENFAVRDGLRVKAIEKITNQIGRMREITGLADKDAFGFGWQKALHEEDRDWTVEDWTQNAESNGIFRMEYRFAHDDGRVTWVISQAVPMRDSSGKTISYVGTLTDITERKEAEEKIKTSEARYQDLYDNAPDMFVSVDAATGAVLE